MAEAAAAEVAAAEAKARLDKTTPTLYQHRLSTSPSPALFYPSQLSSPVDYTPSCAPRPKLNETSMSPEV